MIKDCLRRVYKDGLCIVYYLRNRYLKKHVKKKVIEMGKIRNLKKWFKENGCIIIAYMPVIGLMTVIVLILLKDLIRIF
jgi:hypothetical protein